MWSFQDSGQTVGTRVAGRGIYQLLLPIPRAVPLWFMCTAANQMGLGSDLVPATPRPRDLGQVPSLLPCPVGLLSESREGKQVKARLIIVVAEVEHGYSQ